MLQLLYVCILAVHILKCTYSQRPNLFTYCRYNKIPTHNVQSINII